MAEFALIERFFADLGASREDVILGVGDDAAVVRLDAGMMVVSAAATLGADSANLWSDQPESIGQRLLATALNRLTAQAAEGAWLTLAVTLPKPDEHWLEDFCRGFSVLAHKYRLRLVGGDTTSGPLAVTTIVNGLRAHTQPPALQGAKLGDSVVMTGTLGYSALTVLASALPHRFSASERRDATRMFAFPSPPADTVAHLLKHANAAADLSDGLPNGLENLLTGSGLGISISVSKLPIAPGLRDVLSEMNAWQQLVNSSGDHEIALCLPAAKLYELRALGTSIGVTYTPIGVVETQPGLRFVDQQSIEQG